MTHKSIPVVVSLVAIAATPLPAQGETTPVPKIEAYARYADTPSFDPAGRHLLRGPRIDEAADDIPGSDYPPELLAEPGKRDLELQLLVSLDSTGKAGACTVRRVDVIEGGSRHQGELTDSLARHACEAATRNLRFHYALDEQGNPAAAEIPIIMRYEWERRPLSPAPPPPASWVPSKDGWPPPYYSPSLYRQVSLQPPRWKDFIEPERGQPRRADVGILFTTNETGRMTECRVAAPSGVAAYDAASCPALQSVPQRFALNDFPIRLEWRGREATIRFAAQARGPELAVPAIPDPALIEGVELPQRAAVVVELGVDADGKLAFCELYRPSFVDRLDLATCGLFDKETRFSAPVGLFGEPAEGRLRLEVDWNRPRIRRWGY